jgi:hypothetical protein
VKGKAMNVFIDHTPGGLGLRKISADGFRRRQPLMGRLALTATLADVFARLA